ncbi:MAG: hypothetical protein LLG14_00545 [Nocardiaceae bacterium]|nr:hypothetical protein [Nocardiaceae bacterium]
MTVTITAAMEAELSILRSRLEQRPLSGAHLLEITQRMFALTTHAVGRVDNGWELSKALRGVILGESTISPVDGGAVCELCSKSTAAAPEDLRTYNAV